MKTKNHMVQFAGGVLVMANNNKRINEPLPTFNPTLDQLPANPFASTVEPVDASLTREQIEEQRRLEQEAADKAAADESARLAQEDADKAAAEQAKKAADSKAAAGQAKKESDSKDTKK